MKLGTYFPEGKGKACLFQINEAEKQTFKNPDVIKKHRTKKKKKRVCKKKFGFPVGIYGCSGALCFSVVVIFDLRDNRIITDFPPCKVSCKVIKHEIFLLF